MNSLSGSDALRAITDAIRQEQERTRKLDADLAAANAQLLELDVERKELLGQLAQVRVKYLLSSEVASQLQRSDKQVLELPPRLGIRVPRVVAETGFQQVLLQFTHEILKVHIVLGTLIPAVADLTHALP